MPGAAARPIAQPADYTSHANDIHVRPLRHKWCARPEDRCGFGHGLADLLFQAVVRSECAMSQVVVQQFRQK